MNISGDRCIQSYRIYEEIHKILYEIVKESNFLLREHVAVSNHISVSWEVYLPKSSRLRFWHKLAFKYYGHVENFDGLDNWLPFYLWEDSINKIKLSPEYEEKYQTLINSNKFEWILYLQDTTLFANSDRELFGFIFKEIFDRNHKFRKKFRPKFRNPEQRGKVNYPLRKRGYNDKGSMRKKPLPYIPSDSYELQRIEDERIRRYQKISDDIANFRKGGLG